MKKNEHETYRFAERLREPLMALPIWYREHHRILPWRDTGDPYDVWLSEIMLQQTRVAAVREYFIRFKEEIPDVDHLAAIPEERLLKLWEGLGYYSRPRNMKRAAEIIVRDYQGKIPEDPKLLRSLPGIGSYTAGAIASIAYGVPEPAVDGNVLRVCSRVSGNDSDIGQPSTKKALEDALREMMGEFAGRGGPVHPGDLNQSLMELGALICVPNGEPLCGDCPIRDHCEAAIRDLTGILPVKAAKKKRRIEKRTVLLIENDGRYLIRRRPAKGLLAGLWEFPSVGGYLDERKALLAAADLLSGRADPLYIERLPDAKHIFSHVEWRMHAYRIRLADPSGGIRAAFDSDDMRFANAEEMRERYSLPSAFAAYRDPVRDPAEER